MIEERMNAIAEGRELLDVAAIDTLEKVGPLYERLDGMQEVWLEQMKQAMEEHKDLYQI